VGCASMPGSRQRCVSILLVFGIRSSHFCLFVGASVMHAALLGFCRKPASDPTFARATLREPQKKTTAVLDADVLFRVVGQAREARSYPPLAAMAPATRLYIMRTVLHCQCRISWHGPPSGRPAWRGTCAASMWQAAVVPQWFSWLQRCNVLKQAHQRQVLATQPHSSRCLESDVYDAGRWPT